MPYKPFNNALGERIYNEISMEAWKMWIEHSKMVVNEYRLDLTSPRGARQVSRSSASSTSSARARALPPDFVPAPKK